MHILVVDDDAKNRKILATILKSTGECKTAEDGTEALLAFKDAWRQWRPFGLILLDIMMPGMSGEEVLESIREMERDRKVAPDHQAKIVMVTAVSEKETVTRCFQLGCNDFIIKPYDMDTIFQKLSKLGIQPQPC